MFNDCLFEFGSCKSIRNYLFLLDLDDHKWTGVERPQVVSRLTQTNFHFCKPTGETTLLNVLRVLYDDEQIVSVWSH